MGAETGRSIAVIGGGISGITTAILLQLTGRQVTLYSKVKPSFEPDAARPAEFATLHAAASVIPHSVASPKLSHWTEISQQCFRALSLSGSCGVRRQVHYEICEAAPEPDPPYAASVENFAHLNADELNQLWVPKRSAARQTYGWKFDAFFCEAPQYLHFLYAFFARMGGSVVPSAAAALASMLALDHDIFVNCTGFAAPALLASIADVDDPLLPEFEPLPERFPPKLIRGHYLRLDVKQVLTGHRGELFSYSYKPAAEVYPTASGVLADVYCYQRSDAWLLGGSRQTGTLDAGGHWVGEQTVGPVLEFGGTDGRPIVIPAAIFEVNADIVLRLSDGRLDLARLMRDDPGIVAAGIGYRFVRASASDNVRVGCSRVRIAGGHKYILHNYGHGGAGYTLSWGCAFDILQLVGRVVGTAPRFAGHSRFSTGDVAIRGLLENVIARLLAHEAFADPAGA